MRRVRRRRFRTKAELLPARSLPILVGDGALPYSHESLHEFICTLDPLVIQRLLKKDGTWIRSSSKARKERKTKRHCHRKALRTASALKYALQPDAPDPTCVSAFPAYDTGQSVYLGLDSAEAPIVVDSGASLSITPHKGDFIGKIEQLDTTIQGISSVMKIQGVGTFRWHLKDIFGTINIIDTRAYYIPDAGMRLFSPQVYFQEQQAGSYSMTSTGTVLTTSDGCELTFGYQLGSNLPMIPPPDMCTLSRVNQSQVNLSFDDISADSVSCSLSLVDQENQNLSAAEKELLEEHWKKCHVDAQCLQALVRKADGQAPIIPTKHIDTRSCKPPRCAACCLAKASTKGSDTYRTIPNPKKINALVREDLKPGDHISIDQCVSSIPGRLSHTFGKEAKKNKLTGGTIFADHATGHVFIYNQVSARAGENLVGKKKYERLALDSGVSIQTYHADNGIFATKAFKAHCDYKGQELEFSGVGAHHQNGVAKRAIKTVSSLARTMLLHMSLHWPEQAGLELWPFALEHAAYVWNHLPRADTHLAPQELYTGSLFFSYAHLARLHTFGCPVYVLHPRLQDGQKVPKWQPRARCGQFLGYSTDYSSSIGLILNTNTGNIIPQYHVVHDDNFTTVASVDSNKPFDATSWNAILQTGVKRYLSDDIDRFGKPLPLPSLHDEWLTDSKNVMKLSAPSMIDPHLRGSLSPMFRISSCLSFRGSRPHKHQLVRLRESLARIRGSWILILLMVVFTVIEIRLGLDLITVIEIRLGSA
jgi:hypothetical protein